MRNNTPKESSEQIALFQWAEFAAGRYPELRLLYHIPNGGSRNAIEAHNLRLQGVKAGVPDICLPVPKGGYAALYIELKRKSKGRVSDAQRGWIEALKRAGNCALVCKGFDEARNTILEYLRN
jgi:hypothetical protein